MGSNAGFVRFPSLRVVHFRESTGLEGARGTLLVNQSTMERAKCDENRRPHQVLAGSGSPWVVVSGTQSAFSRSHVGRCLDSPAFVLAARSPRSLPTSKIVLVS